MWQKLFFLSLERAFQHAVEIDTTGRTIVITYALPDPEFAGDVLGRRLCIAYLNSGRSKQPPEERDCLRKSLFVEDYFFLCIPLGLSYSHNRTLATCYDSSP